ncbi:MAG: malto-oligosyltrehalose synthase [Rhizobiaceae bacterium]|nr:malto-oligosyltrehalose synthase [Rhizobiaceae bacterium]MCV0407525.1 malto-oligosyltrehalose synthase [Rhizobiaceae bacterium]
MTVPTATYRLQFRNGMTFESALALVPYWRDLGISHLYASPVFTAVAGSTHGYDVIDYNEIEPVLGGRSAFEKLCRALRSAGMGVILDIVPNHMAASLENPWWRDVLQWGCESRYAGHFDIDWNRPLTLPVLGGSFDEALQAGEISIVADDRSGTLALAYFEHRFPLHPRSWEWVLADLPGEDEGARRLAGLAREATPAQAPALQEALRSLFASRSSSRLDERLAARSGDTDFISLIHERQPWRLRFWKDASKDLSYRRFFEITGLVGLAVEKENVFDDAHCLALDLLREGLIEGLRVDHVDGMADPGGYLRRLREKAGDEAYVVVEKILGPGEQLPPDWPVAGTTGYEYIEAAADLLVDAQGLQQMSRAYENATGSASTQTQRRQSKLQIITRNFQGELEQLVALFAGLPGAASPGQLRNAIVQLLASLPVYRTYGWTGSLGDADRAVILKARKTAAEADPSLSLQALDFVVNLLVSGGEANATVTIARTRFQQLSGPAMAKGVEDTLFYRDHRFLALNEVGGEPDRGDLSLERFHAAMEERANRVPHALTATATHDTKRGEDARARLYVLSQMPDRWADLVERWRRLHRDHVSELAGGAAPEPAVEWMIYQALLGVWSEHVEALEDIRQRFAAYVEKVLREAKLRTSWTEIDSAYENAVQAYVSQLLNSRNEGFLAEFSAVAAPIIQAGWLNSLTQTLVKLTAPGVPDIYQGTEGEDFSLVDPDNRRPVDWDRLRRTLRDGVPRYPDAAFKQFMIKRVLSCRRAHPNLFSDGDYRPLRVSGSASRHLVAFSRRHGEEMLIVFAPRLPLERLSRNGELEQAMWRDLAFQVPDDAASMRWREVIGAKRTGADLSRSVASLLSKAPYALLMGSPKR